MKNTRVLLIFFITTTIVSAIFGLLSNLVVDSVPEAWKPYFLPAFIISLLLLIALGVWQVWAENRHQPPEPKRKPPYFHEGWFLKHYYLAQDDFTGRKSELNFLTNWLEKKNDKPLLVLLALGGFGKSALVWHWLNNEAAPKNLQKVVWWGFYDDSSFDTLLKETLEYLDIDPKALSIFEQVEILARYIHQNRILIVMDGFERALWAYSSMGAAYQGDEENKNETTNNQCVSIHAGKFLERVASINAQGRVLLTSRLLPDDLKIKGSGNLLAGCLLHDLDKLTKEDAVAFFRKQDIKGGRAEIETACDVYGYHPLSLRLLAGRLVQERSRDIRLAEKFKIDSGLKGRQNHILKVAYESLPKRRRVLLNKIAAFRSPMTLQDIKVFEEKSVWWRKVLFGEDNLQHALNDFVSRGLLHHDPNKDKYDLHPIVRRFAYDRLTATDRTGAHERLVNYFDAVSKPAKVEKLEDLASVIELYHHMVRAGNLDRAMKLYYDRLWKQIYYQFGSYQLELELLRAVFLDGEDKPPRLKDESAQAWTLNELANSYSLSGQPRRAVPLMEMQIAIREKQGIKKSVATGLGNLANRNRDLGALSAAERNLQRRIDLCREIEDEFGEAVGHQELGHVLSDRGAWQEAEDELLKSQKVFDNLGTGQTNFGSGNWVYRSLRCLLLSRTEDQKDINLSIEFANQALKLAEEHSIRRSPYPRDYVRAYWLLGAAFRANNELTLAEENLSKALNLCRQINLVEIEANILLDLARLRYAQGDFQDAQEKASEALMITERSGYVLQGADVNLFLAQYAPEQEKDKVSAKEYAETALKFAYCDGPPYYYKVAYHEAERLLEQLK